MCPHTRRVDRILLHVSAYCYIYVLCARFLLHVRMLLYPHTALCVLVLLYVSAYYYTRVLVLFYVSAYCYLCSVVYTTCMCPHTIYESSMRTRV